MEFGSANASASSLAGSDIEVLFPPARFGIVEPGVYRSGLPAVTNFAFLKTLGLKHVIILSPDSVARNVSSFFKDCGMTVWQTGAPSRAKNSWKPSWKTIDDDIIKTSLEIILRADRHPLLICESSGVQRVGVVVGCLRRLEGWNLNSVINEYRAFARAKTRHNHEQSIELFDTDLVVLPENVPEWYADQIRMQREDEEMYESYAEKGLISSTGKLETTESDKPDDVVEADKLAYRKHYFNKDTGPLNSVRSPNQVLPRLQRLTMGDGR